MRLETERLSIIALNPNHLDLFINNMTKLENELNCSYQAEPIIGTFKEILSHQLAIVKTNKSQYLWQSFWLIMRKSDRVIVGLFDFKNMPNEQGEVEIGYGLGKQFEHHGYMSETVRVMCNWGMKQKGVKHIIAETDLNGIGSQHILQRCGFVEYLRDSSIWWKL